MGNDIQHYYTAVLAALEARKAAIEAAILTIRQEMHGQAIEIQPSSGNVATSTVATGSVQEATQGVVPGIFHGLSISEAARKFLMMTKTKQTTNAICQALLAGGVESSSKNFYSNVFTRLTRTKGFIKIGKGWALAEWHPTHVPTQAKPKRQRKKPRPAKKTRTPKGSAAKPGLIDVARLEVS